MKQMTLVITSTRQMRCHGCERSVEFLLSDMEGIARVEADHRTQHIQVDCDPHKLMIGDVQAALRDLGYEATPDD